MLITLTPVPNPLRRACSAQSPLPGACDARGLGAGGGGHDVKGEFVTLDLLEGQPSWGSGFGGLEGGGGGRWVGRSGP